MAIRFRLSCPQMPSKISGRFRGPGKQFLTIKLHDSNSDSATAAWYTPGRMRPNVLLVPLLAASCVLHAQTPSPASVPVQPGANHAVSPGEAATYTSDAGFSYTYPADWTVIDSKPMLPAIQLEAKDKADSEVEKQGVDCTQIGLLLRHSALRSSIVVLVLPYGCVGSALRQSDLAAVASGIAEGVKKNYDIKDPAYAAYKLGKISFSAERSQATSKAHPELTYTLETTCGLLSKAMVCWMAFANNEAAISALENGMTSLEGAPVLPLVPPAVFAKKQN